MERGRYSLCLRLVRLVEAVRTGFQQPSGPGAEVGTAQARHGGSMRGAGSGAGGGGAHDVSCRGTQIIKSHFQLQSAFLDTLTASCTPKRRAVTCPSPKGRADKINFSS